MKCVEFEVEVNGGKTERRNYLGSVVYFRWSLGNGLYHKNSL